MKSMPPAEAKLYGVLMRMLPAPGGKPTSGSRPIKNEELAKLTGYSKRWVFVLLQRLEKKNFIETLGRSGAEKWIRRLPLEGLRLGGSSAGPRTQKEEASPEPRPGLRSFSADDRRTRPPLWVYLAKKTKAPRAAASQPKRRRKETAQSTKTGVEINVEPHKEKLAEIPERRQEVTISIPPPDPAPSPMVPTAMVIPAPSTAPADPEPANRVSPIRSTKSGIPPAGPPRRGAPIKKLLEYVYSQPVDEELIKSLLQVPGVNEQTLRYALEVLCRREYGYQDRYGLISAIRLVLNEY